MKIKQFGVCSFYKKSQNLEQIKKIFFSSNFLISQLINLFTSYIHISVMCQTSLFIFCKYSHSLGLNYRSCHQKSSTATARPHLLPEMQFQLSCYLQQTYYWSCSKNYERFACKYICIYLYIYIYIPARKTITVKKHYGSKYKQVCICKFCKRLNN